MLSLPKSSFRRAACRRRLVDMEKSAYNKMKQLLRWSDNNIELKIKAKGDTVVRIARYER